VFTKEYDPPKFDGSGNIRDGLRDALKLLKAAGWEFKNEKLVNDKSGQPFEFEILLDDPQMERIVLPFAKNLERMGVTARVRTVDVAQYEKRMETFDFDTAVVVFGQSLSPGNEQREYWGSEAADQQGSRNLIGIKSPVIDALIEELIRSPDRASLIAHTRARIFTSRRSGWPIGTSSAGRRSRPNTASASTPGGSTRRPNRPSKPKRVR
jgi:microcin C transport system substrate-binding protein